MWGLRELRGQEASHRKREEASLGHCKWRVLRIIQKGWNLGEQRAQWYGMRPHLSRRPLEAKARSWDYILREKEATHRKLSDSVMVEF